MSGINKVILVGRLGQSPEVSELPSGVKVAKFSLATSEKWKNKQTGDIVESTEWHNIVLWRWLAVVADNYLKKGSLVYIEGKLKTESWDDQGTIKYRTKVIADQLNILSGGTLTGDVVSRSVEEEDLPY